MKISFKTRLTFGTILISALIFGSGALLFLAEFRTSVRSTTETLLRSDSQTYVAAIASRSADESGNGDGNNVGNTLDAPALWMRSLESNYLDAGSLISLL